MRIRWSELLIISTFAPLFIIFLNKIFYSIKMEKENNNILDEVTQSEYKYGFVTDIEMDMAPKGLDEDTVRFISAKKNEPEFMLEYRLKAFAKWKTMKEPDWAHLNIPMIDYQDIIYYAAPKKKIELDSLDDVDPELRATFEKLGISLEEQKRLSGVAVDAVFDSVSVKTTFQETLRNMELFSVLLVTQFKIILIS